MGFGQGAVEGVGMNRSFWRGKRVFVTGHTGFKGGWLSLWLADMGAEVHGYALAPATEPALFDVAKVASHMASSTLADIRDARSLSESVRAARPEIVFHLAAQPLVRYSYDAPLETYAVNVMGTAHLLEAVRHCPGARAVVNVTTDKCYENREWVWPYREDDVLGGRDPYSSSKACAELVTSAYRASFLGQAGVQLASVRAGNVIGGGDWAADRLVPDFLRAFDAGRPLEIRFPEAVRPWQHVLEPLYGYLLLAERLHRVGAPFTEAWNFGPRAEDARPVRWIVDHLCAKSHGASWRPSGTEQPHEANLLRLDSTKAATRLGWHPRWSLEVTLDKVLEWHRCWRQGADMDETCLRQIHAYEVAGRPA